MRPVLCTCVVRCFCIMYTCQPIHNLLSAMCTNNDQLEIFYVLVVAWARVPHRICWHSYDVQPEGRGLMLDVICVIHTERENKMLRCGDSLRLTSCECWRDIELRTKSSLDIFMTLDPRRRVKSREIWHHTRLLSMIIQVPPL